VVGKSSESSIFSVFDNFIKSIQANEQKEDEETPFRVFIFLNIFDSSFGHRYRYDTSVNGRLHAPTECLCDLQMMVNISNVLKHGWGMQQGYFFSIFSTVICVPYEVQFLRLFCMMIFFLLYAIHSNMQSR